MDKRIPVDPDFLEAMGYRPRVEPVRVRRKPGRNDPCPCKSGKKYKRCCGATKQQKAYFKAQQNRHVGAYAYE